MYAWTQGHSKPGSDDPLVKEERIALSLITYAPNLWKVFLFYAQDVNAKVPDLKLPFPQAAQEVERMLFGIPKGAPYRSSGDTSNAKLDFTIAEPFIMTQAACTRMCLDYGIIPHLVSKEEMKQIMNKVNKSKQLTKPKPQSQRPNAYTVKPKL